MHAQPAGHTEFASLRMRLLRECILKLLQYSLLAHLLLINSMLKHIDCSKVVAFQTMEIGMKPEQWTKVTHVFAKIVYAR